MSNELLRTRREEMMLTYGFKFVGKCHCGGTLTLKYKRNNYTVKYQPSKDTFTFKDGGTTIKGKTNAELLEAYIQAKIPGLYN